MRLHTQPPDAPLETWNLEVVSPHQPCVSYFRSCTQISGWGTKDRECFVVLRCIRVYSGPFTCLVFVKLFLVLHKGPKQVSSSKKYFINKAIHAVWCVQWVQCVQVVNFDSIFTHWGKTIWFQVPEMLVDQRWAFRFSRQISPPPIDEVTANSFSN